MAEPPVTVYWRPGCPYCRRLRRDLRTSGLPTLERNIWADSGAAAVVRGYADGNETVPTVVVAGQGFVNPSAAEVLERVRAAVPDLALDPDLARSGRRALMLRRVRFGLVAASSVAGFAALGAGEPAVFGVLQAAAAAGYVAFGVAIARVARLPAA